MTNVVYVIQNKYVPNQYKIGISSNWAKRSKQLKVGDATTEIYVGNVIHNHQVEQQLHKRYASYRLPQSEWFHLNDEQLDDVITTIGSNASYVPKPKVHTVYKEHTVYVDKPVYVRTEVPVHKPVDFIKLFGLLVSVPFIAYLFFFAIGTITLSLDSKQLTTPQWVVN